MKQQCHISFIYLSWIIFIGGIVNYAARGNYPFAGLWIVMVPALMWAYVKYFPSLSRVLGYGSVVDTPASAITRTSAHVIVYTGRGCPFCPIVKHRLQSLQATMGFELKDIDVTFNPELLIAKGIRALPVTEVDGRLLTGNATSQQLASFISGT